MWTDTHSVETLSSTTLWANSADDKLMIFSYFSQKIGFDISCKLSLKCQNLFSRKNNIFPRKQDLTFHANGDNLHGMPKRVFWDKQGKYFKMSSAENCTQSAKR